MNIADIPSLQYCAYYWSIVIIATTIAIIENAALFALPSLGSATGPAPGGGEGGVEDVAVTDGSYTKYRPG